MVGWECDLFETTADLTAKRQSCYVSASSMLFLLVIVCPHQQIVSEVSACLLSLST